MEESEGRVGKMKAWEAELMAALGSSLLSHCYRPDSPAVTGTNLQETLYFTNYNCAWTTLEIRETAVSETDRDPAVCVLQTYSFHK